MQRRLLSRSLICGLLCLVGSFIHAQIAYRCFILDNQDKPIIGAYVMLGTFSSVTDKSGLASFEIEKGKVYALNIRSMGYQSLSQTLKLVEDQTDTFQMIEEIYQIETVELTASWIKEDQPFTFSNVNAAELEEVHVGQDMPFLLRWLPSTVVTSDAGTGIGYTSLRIRGSDPTRINVTVDGIPLNDSESQGVYWVDLPDLASSVEAIQVQRGVGTSTNGAGAFGGTINVKTRTNERTPFAHLETSGGSFGTLRGNLQFGSGAIGHHFSVEGRVSKLRSDGYIDRSRADLSSLHLATRYFSDKNSLKISLYEGKEVTYQAWNGVPQQYIGDDRLNTFNTAGQRSNGSFHPDEVDNYRQTHIHAIYKQKISGDILINAALHYTKGRGYFEQYRIEDNLLEYGISPPIVGDSTIAQSDLIRRRWLDNDFYGGIFSLTQKSPNTSFEWSVGGGFNEYRGSHFGKVIWSRWSAQSEKDHTYYHNDASKQDLNLYTQLQFELSSELLGFLDLQWRHVDYRFFGFDQLLNQGNQEVRHNFFNPKAGISYSSGGAKYYYSLAVAHREPNRNDYVESSPVSRPKAERLIDQELGIKLEAPNYFFGANFFYMSYRDQLILTGRLNDVGEYTRINTPKSYRAGLEIQSLWAISKAFQIGGNATWSTNRISAFEESLDNWDSGLQDLRNHKNTPIAFSPSLVAGMTLSYTVYKNDQTKFVVNNYHKYVGSQFLDNTGAASAVLDPYYFSDLHLLLQLDTKWCKELIFKIIVRNLLDASLISNGWIYRYRSPSYDATSYDPHAASESGDVYNLKGLYPQAGRNIMLGATLKF